MKIFKIEENDANQRLDKFLKKLLKNSSLSLIYKINRKNKVKVNSKREDNEYKLQANDEIKLFLNDDEYDKLSVTPPELFSAPRSDFDSKNIIYEDKCLLIINKDPWVIVHPGDFKTSELSLIEQVHDYLWNKLNSLTFKPSLVHRIDKDTSWIIIIAKTKSSLDFMLKELQTDRIDKYYLAICIWNLSWNWKITKKLRRINEAKFENKVVVDEKNGQTAVTNYRVIKNNIEWKYSLVECRLETWRMHQIRVHLSSIWFPILWDNSYWNKSENSYARLNFWVTRQFLHAYKISFTHPEKKTKITFYAKLKNDMNDLLWEIDLKNI
ncbi:MAG: Pseudouridine synthase [uncultured bacterium (gcode 4)]|uniref:Pseudouridine synthase n=1 Tax=uncultured bacterium (gcode 4) TaxID=1234023 RepID=K2G7N5_9BACT|nr:MAG: Pseudouridine synthase [uncultured bacterium (gcode 4)]